MSIATVEIRSFSGPDLVELDGVNRPAIIRLNVGPAGAAGAPGPNSVTSATTSNGTCDLWIDTLKVGTGTASGVYAVALGTGSTASAANSFAGGESTTASGAKSFAIGFGSTASGENSFACGSDVIANNNNSFAIGFNTTASGAESFAAGYGSTASGGTSIALGSGCTSSGDFSFATGISSTASGTFSRAQGSACEATETYSVATGVRAKAIHQGASVESDSQDADVESLTNNEKTFRFANGYRFLGGSATFEADVTVDGILYADHIHGNIAGSVYAHVRAGEALAKGDPVYVSGSHGTGANLIPIVSKADASNIAKMPAIGIMDADLANNANGHMVITGTIFDLNTAAYSVNATLYVATGGGLTATPPAANSQPVARVDRSNANNGALIVSILSNASNGGNGSGDANKLVRFSSAGTIPVASIGGLGTGIATFLATPTSANLAAAVTDETGSGSLVFGTSPTITTPTISRGSTGQVFIAQDNNNATVTMTTDANGRNFFTVNGKTNGVAQSGAYITANGFEESWIYVNTTNNATGNRVMRFGNLSSRFSIQRMNDTNTSITATPFSLANNAPTNSFYMDASGNTGYGTSSPTAFVDINSNTLRIRTARTPASATATGNAGDICWDANYIYVCTATNTWKRTAISTW